VWAISTVPRSDAFREGFQHIDLPHVLQDLQTVLVDDREAGGIVAAVLQSLQPIDQDPLALSRSDVSDDPAHRLPPVSGPTRTDHAVDERPGLLLGWPLRYHPDYRLAADGLM
jgi:hypothetical protein